MGILFHPGLLLVFTGFLIYLIPGRSSKILYLLVPAVGLVWAVTQKGDNTERILNISGVAELQILKLDNMAWLFAFTFLLAAVLLAVYNLHAENRKELAAETIYAGSALGVILAGDWITLLIFWEAMAIASWLVVIASGTQKAWKAGFRYLLIHMFGGNMLLAGVVMKVSEGQLLVGNLNLNGDPAAWFIFIGMAVNCAIPPLNGWIADAYPQSTQGGSVYLGTFTTKTAVYALIRCFAGLEALLYIGIFMALFGAAMAFIENNLRKLFSYHIISQLGYMVAAAGIGSQLALDGAAAHVFNNILYKGVLFMCAGAVLKAAGTCDITRLGGIGRKMPLTGICCMMASLAIAGFPLFNGFISKGLIMNAVSETGNGWAEILLLAASVGTLLSVTLKVNYFVFWKEPELHGGCAEITNVTAASVCPQRVPFNMKIAMTAGAAACLITGVFPSLLQEIIPFGSDGHAYTVDHITQYLQLFAGAALVFALLVEKMAPHEGISLDTDWFFRRPMKYGFYRLSEVGLFVSERMGSAVKDLTEAVSRTLLKPAEGRFCEQKAKTEKKEKRRKAGRGLEEDDVLKKTGGTLVAVDAAMLLMIGAVVCVVQSL